MATKVRVGGVSAVRVASTSRAESGGTLAALSDTSISGPADGYLLVYNGASNVWVGQAELGTNTVIDGGTF